MSVPARNGAGVFAVRPMTPDDAAAFCRFVADVPDGERRFLKERVDDPLEVCAELSGERKVRRFVVVDTLGDPDELVGVAGAFPGEGWSSHVAEVRVLVSARHRGRGLGRRLARAALVEALELGCTHAYVEVVAEQEALVAMFQDLGFEPEALLADFVRDGTGELHDLLLLTHRVDEQWGRSRLLGLDEVVA